MIAGSHFFIDPTHCGPYVHGTLDLWLVILSVLVSIFSATMALQTAEIARHTLSRLYRNVAIGTGTFALGGGIWSMHFIGMLAFELPTHVHYDSTLTILSLLPAIVASWMALRLLTKPEVNGHQFVLSGVLVGSGIGAMHYAGMAAMYSSLQMRYEPFTFLLSIVVAVSLSILALWVRYGLHRILVNARHRWMIAGVVMGLATACMHYTGMAAVRFTGEAGSYSSEVMIDKVMASLVLSMFTFTVTVMVNSLNNLIRAREMYNHMEASKSRLRATLDTAVDGIITIDGRGRILGFNHSAERLFGWSANEVMGHNINMLMPDPDRSRHDSYLRNYQTTGIPEIIGIGREVMGLRKDGSLMPMRLAVGRIDLPGELRFVGFVTDISERHALEASLREAAEQAELAAAAKSTFLANMSHEIRTPMNSIIGFTELLLQSELSPVQRNHLNTIRQSSRSLLGLINNILDTTRMEKGHLELENIDFSLKGLAMQIESSLRLAAHAKHLHLSISYPPQIPKYFRGDPLRMLQVLNNLTANAIKFTETGEVELKFDYSNSMVHIQVRDTGIGMTEQQIESIFAPFTQADASISRRFGGTGLGTTIVRQLVELMGGRIEVHSQLGQGSIFQLWLPLAVGETPASQLDAGKEPELPPLHILIADDVPQNLELLALTLQRRQHRVTQAKDGQEAVSHYIADQFDLVLMDVHMPGIDGLQAARMIRQHERLSGRTPTPIIALTASVMEEDRQAALQAGMNGFASKPLEVAELFQEMEQVLHHRHRSSGASTSDIKTSKRAADLLIDWATGEALWGSRARLLQSITQFMDTQQQRYPLPEADATDIDWDRALASLHGIRGAAGNLSMVSVTKLAAELESQVRQGDYKSAQPQLAELQRLLQRVQAELPARDPSTAGPVTARGPALSADWLQSAQSLLALSAHNQIDDALLERVCTDAEALGAHALVKPLREALDGFDFMAAQQLLRDFIASHSSDTRI